MFCSAAAKLAKKLNVDCPIIDGIFRVIHEGAEPLGVNFHLTVTLPCGHIHMQCAADVNEAVMALRWCTCYTCGTCVWSRMHPTLLI